MWQQYFIPLHIAFFEFIVEVWLNNTFLLFLLTGLFRYLRAVFFMCLQFSEQIFWEQLFRKQERCPWVLQLRFWGSARRIIDLRSSWLQEMEIHSHPKKKVTTRDCLTIAHHLDEAIQSHSFCPNYIPRDPASKGELLLILLETLSLLKMVTYWLLWPIMLSLKLIVEV